MSSDLGDVRLAKLEDMPYIVSLSKKESISLGFIPKMAYEAAITGIKLGDRWSNVCNDKLFVIECNGDLVGFCLASFGIPNAISKKERLLRFVYRQMLGSYCVADCCWILWLIMARRKALWHLAQGVQMTLNQTYFGKQWVGFVLLKDLASLIKILGSKPVSV